MGEPENEPSLKGARDSFVESLRTNTSLVRRRLRAPELRVEEHIVGRQSLTPVDVIWLKDIADPDMVRRVGERLDDMDVDGVESAGNLEEYLVPAAASAFPLILSTQRPDRFCRELLDGRVGLLCDGIPLGWVAPGTADQFFKTGQDRAYHWMAASALRLIRYFCAAVTLLLPGLYIALVTYHPEAIPGKLALSIVAAKQEVPFSTIFEVLIMLLSFEVIQEAGLRLPGPIGSTVSILGGLVVGNAAVDAHIVSPAVLIAVAIAGVAGYTMPSQDFGNALRLWRFGLTVLSSLGGLFGLVLGCVSLLYHLAGLESFGVAYLAPFTAGPGTSRGRPNLIRPPLPTLKWRTGRSAPEPEEPAVRRGVSLALAAALLLSGCGALPRPREMGDMALLRVMGVDRGEGGPAMSAATGPQAPEQPARLWQGRAALSVPPPRPSRAAVTGMCSSAMWISCCWGRTRAAGGWRTSSPMWPGTPS